jgi:type I restriction enzyme, S subunit
MDVMTENKVEPKLRFKEFKDDWNKVFLGNLANSISSGKSKCEESGSFDVYGSTGKIGVCSKYSHQGRYILAARVGANAGFLNCVQGSFGVSDNTLVLDLKDTSSIRFIFYYLLSFNLNRLVFGSGQPLITGGQLKKLKFYLPSLPEQQKIASFLSAVDKKLQQLKKKKELLEEYKKGVMQKIFSQELRFKDDNGNNYPDWKEKKIDDIALCLDNKRKPLNGSERNKMQGDIPYYGANGIVDYVNDYLLDEELVLLAEDGGNFFDFSNKPIAQLISGKSWVNNHAHILKAKIEFVTTDFLFYSLVHKDIRRFIVGGSRVKLNKSDLMSIRMTLPCIDEQLKIANFLSSLDSKIKLVSTQIENTKAFKKGLLQQMFV